MALAGEQDIFETLVGADQRIRDTDGVGRVDIVVHVTVDQHQVTLEAGGQFLVRLDAVDERSVCLVDLFEDAVVLFAPPAVVDAVVMVAGAGNGRFEEVRILQDGRRGHEAAAGVAMNADAVQVDPLVACAQLLDGIFLVFQTIVAQVSVAVVVIPLGAVGMAAAVAHRNHNHAQLGQAVGAQVEAPGNVVGLDLGPGIHVVGDGIYLRRVKVEGLVQFAPKVGNAVGRLYLEAFRELVAGGQQSAEVGFFQGGAFSRSGVHQHDGGLVIYAGVIGYQVFPVVRRRGQHIHVVHIQLYHGAAAEQDAVVVHLVGILGRIHATGAHHQVGGRGAQHIFHVVGAFRELALEGAVGPVQIQVGPAVPLAPPDEVAGREQERLTVFHIGVHALRHQGAGAVGLEVDAAQVQAFEVPAAAKEEEMAVAAQPAGAAVVQIAVFHLHILLFC